MSKAFGWSEIARSDSPSIDNNFLEDNSWIYHPDLQRVISGFCDRMRCSAKSCIRFHGFFPVPKSIPRIAALGYEHDGLRQLIIKRDRILKPAIRHEIQCRAENSFHIDLARGEQIHLIFQTRGILARRCGGCIQLRHDPQAGQRAAIALNRYPTIVPCLGSLCVVLRLN